MYLQPHSMLFEARVSEQIWKPSLAFSSENKHGELLWHNIFLKNLAVLRTSEKVAKKTAKLSGLTAHKISLTWG